MRRPTVLSASVVVANPGGLPWIAEAAAGFARAGLLRRYIAPFGSADSTMRRGRLLPKWIRNGWEAELRRRQLPGVLVDSYVQHCAGMHEVVFVASQRTGLSRRSQLLLRTQRNKHFDHCVGRRLDPSDSAVVASKDAALETLRRAHRLSVRSYLDYPIAHHAFSRQLLQEEARLVPEYAHTLQFHNWPPALLRRMEREIEVADYIFCLSTFQKRSFIEMGVSPDKLIVTPLGVDLEMFQPSSRREEAGKFRILFKGQITQRKGLSYLVEGFRRAAIPNSELLLAGSVVGSRKPWSDVPGVMYRDHLPYRSQTVPVYQSADVFAVPSIIEGFLMTGLEAMACGLPVILTAHTFGTDIVTDGREGFIVPTRDPDAIAERLRFLYEHPGKRQMMGALARKRAEDFPWEAYGDRVAEAVSAEPAMPHAVSG